MKIITITFLFSVLLYGQAAGQGQAPVNVTPGTPAVKAPAEAAQPPAAGTPPPPVSPDTVVVEVNGKKYTAGELDKLIAKLPAQVQSQLRSQPQMLGQFFLMQRLASDAEKAGLDQKVPYKDQLEMTRLQVLYNAELTDFNNTLQVTPDDQQKYYKDNPDKFKEVKIRVIYIAFNPAPPKTVEGGPKPLTEAEAQAKIAGLEKQIKAGADFGMLARENSDDKTSAAKDGDYGVIKQDSAYPPALKAAVFALKQGEVSAPVKQPNGFYLIRAEEISQQPYNDAFPQIAQAVRQEKFREWLTGLQAQYNLKIENSAYFATRAPAQLQQVH